MIAGVREEVVRTKAIDVLLDARERFLGHRRIGIDCGLKRPNPGRGVSRRLNRIEEADAVARDAKVRPDRDGSALACPVERAMGGPRVPEVVAHEAFDALTRLGAGISQQLRRSLLRVVTEGVLIATRIQMQRRTHAQQEILRLIDSRRIGWPPPQQQRIGQHCDRARRCQVAERTRRLFHIGLELIQRRVEPCVPHIDQFEQRLQDVRVRRGGMKHATKPLEQHPKPGHRARVEQRQQELGVVRLQRRELVELTHLVSDHDAEIPQRIQECSQELFVYASAEQDQKVDIRVETQMASAVASERQHHDLVVRTADFGKQLPQHGVDAVGVTLERRSPPYAAQDIRLKF